MKSISENMYYYVYDLDEHKLMSESYCLISGIGYECRTEASQYYFDCMNQPRNECIFQYTTAGEGMLVIDKKSYPMRAGQAFLLEKPGHFKYYIPKHSKSWEFKWISFNLPSIRYWTDITCNYGRIIDVDPGSDTMQYWKKLYNLAAREAIGDVFMSSAYAYTFMMKLQRDLLNSKKLGNQQDVFRRCLQSIQERYNDSNLSLNSLAEELGVLPSYLSRTFKEHMKDTYIHYLTAHRISKACEMLTMSKVPIDVIARNVGLPDPNYFSRVFKRVQGVSPTQYRESQITAATHHTVKILTPKNNK